MVRDAATVTDGPDFPLRALVERWRARARALEQKGQQHWTNASLLLTVADELERTLNEQP